eukprot:COSAG01_NODE_1422_length_10360_cov_36.853815_7_plen_272_part_00
MGGAPGGGGGGTRAPPRLEPGRAADILGARRVAAAHWPTLSVLAGVELCGRAVRRRMRAIYAVHNPAKLGDVDRLLAKYAAQGRDDADGRARQWELCLKIQEKYLETAGSGSQGGCPDCPDDSAAAAAGACAPTIPVDGGGGGGGGGEPGGSGPPDGAGHAALVPLIQRQWRARAAARAARAARQPEADGSAPAPPQPPPPPPPEPEPAPVGGGGGADQEGISVATAASVLSPRDMAARRVQAQVRGFLAREQFGTHTAAIHRRVAVRLAT